MNDSSSIFNALKGLNLNKILNTANRTLNFVNKAIPMYKEIKPTINTITKSFSKKENEIIDEIKASRPIKIKKETPIITDNRNSSNDTLTFFQ